MDTKGYRFSQKNFSLYDRVTIEYLFSFTSQGSYVNESYGWPAVFYCIGFIALVWTAVLK